MKTPGMQTRPRFPQKEGLQWKADESSDSASNKGRTQRLADALLADRNKVKTKHNIIPCFACGQTFVYKGRQGELNGRFCSLRCQQCFDDGNPSYEEQREHERRLMNAPLDSFVVVAGPPGMEVGKSHYAGVGFKFTPMRRGSEGFYIACKHCNKEFESKGLRCCSPECEKAYRETEARRAMLKEAGIAPTARRMCAGPACDRPIPKWKNGRQVSAKVRFCSDLCRKRAAKAA
jgi:hypothetical protein